MKGIFSKILKKDSLKVTSYSAISTMVNMLTKLVTVKVVATTIGPSGVAFIGQLMNFQTIAVTISNGGLIKGVTKYIAEYKNNIEDQKIVIGTSFIITTILSSIVGLLIFSFRNLLSIKILNSEEYSLVFVYFGLFIFFFALNRLLIGIINGYKDFKTWVFVNISSSILGMLFVVILVYYFHLFGALVAIVSFQSIVVIITVLIVRKKPWFKKGNFLSGFNKIMANKLFGFALMALVTQITAPVSKLIVRTYIIETLSAIDAGYWEAMIRISQVYLLVLTTALSTYYLPVFSEIKDDKQISREIVSAYRFFIPLLVFIFGLVFILKKFIIIVLFDHSFLYIEKLFLPQMIGDFFRIAGNILAIQMVAKRKVKMYIYTEILFSISFVIISFIMIKHFGIQGVVYSNAIVYFLYFILVGYLFRNMFFTKTNI